MIWRDCILHVTGLVATILVLWYTPAMAQETARSLDSGGHLRVEHRLSVDRAPAGDSFQAAVVLHIESGWHMQAAQPSFDYLVPTRLDLMPPSGIEVGALRYPPAKQVEFAGDTLAVYDGETPILFSVTVSPDLAPGRYAVEGKLTLQACDDQVCLAPSTLAVTIPVDVVAAGTSVSPANAEWFAAFATADPATPSPADELNRLFGGRSLALTLLAMFLTGLALNLTPCVYPMLSVTVSIFGGQRDTRTVRVFFKALVYVLGMATMYSLLGLLAALTGSMFGGLMQNPWTLAAIGLLLAAMALSMFGLYEFHPPAGLLNRLGGATTAGIVGVYFSGLLVGVFAAPCIGPPIIALLTVVGARGDPWFGFGAFFVLSMGLGAPYLVLGTFSGLLQRLPKSGTWMVWVKKVFGVVLLGVGAFYLALGFLPEVIHWIPLAAAIAGGLYLGFIERTGNEKWGFRRIKWALGAVAVLYGVWQAVAMPRAELEWQAYRPELLAAAAAEAKPVVLDFYADWCIPCHELDRRTFSHPDVIAALSGYVRLKVDMTRDDNTVSRTAAERFDVQGVPTIVFLDASGRERKESRVVGFLSPDDFLQRVPPTRSSSNEQSITPERE